MKGLGIEAADVLGFAMFKDFQQVTEERIFSGTEGFLEGCENILWNAGGCRLSASEQSLMIAFTHLTVPCLPTPFCKHFTRAAKEAWNGDVPSTEFLEEDIWAGNVIVARGSVAMDWVGIRR